MAQEAQKCKLQDAVSKVICNLRSSYQSKFKCSPFEILFNRKPNTIWKQLASGKPSNGMLDKGKSILSQERPKDWNANDRVEDGYKDTLIPKKNLTPAEKDYDTEYASTSKRSSSRTPLQSPFKGKILRKTNESINGNPFYKELNKKIINTSSTIVGLSDGQIIRKSDIAIPQSNSSKIHCFKGNISFPYFSNHDVEVSQKREKIWRENKTRKQQPRTRKHVELGSSDNNTRTRVSRPSIKPS